MMPPPRLQQLQPEAPRTSPLSGRGWQRLLGMEAEAEAAPCLHKQFLYKKRELHKRCNRSVTVVLPGCVCRAGRGAGAGGSPGTGTKEQRGHWS